jgi:rubredoxin
MAEDILRESGYLLPQGTGAISFLEGLLADKQPSDFPVEAVRKLLVMMKKDDGIREEKTMEKWKCTVCGYIHEGPMTEDFKCPRCKQPAKVFERISEQAANSTNPYAGTKTEKNLQEAFSGESQARNKYTYLLPSPTRGLRPALEIFL